MKTTFKVLIPVDFSEASIRALLFAAHAVKRSGGTIYVLNVISPDEGTADVLDLRIGREKLLDRLLRDERLEGISLQPLLKTGDPAKEIVAHAKRYKARVIVLGTDEKLETEPAGKRRVAKQVLRESPCPVIVLNGESLSMLQPHLIGVG
jgi:universal stress protein A